MQIHDNHGRLIGELTTGYTNTGQVIITNTTYDHGRPIFQTISIRDNQGQVRTTTVIGSKILP
jgi:hypothetical protein